VQRCYIKSIRNLRDIKRLTDDFRGSLRQSHDRAEIRRRYGKELEDLTAYAQHLQARSSNQTSPLQRFRSRPTISLPLHSAMPGCLFVLLGSSSPRSIFQDGRLAEQLTINFEMLLIWRRFMNLFNANAVTAGLVAS